MSWGVRFLTGLLLGAWSAAAYGATSPPPGSTLRWRNGETLVGEVSEASAQGLTWKSAIFEEPLLLGWPALRRIDSSQAAVPAKDPFSIALRDGSHLYGDLTSITDDAVVIQSTRHGAVHLKRSAVLRLRRTRSDKVAFSGPTGDVGWSSKNPDQSQESNAQSPAVPRLITGPGGALLLPYWNGNAGMEMPLPESVLVEFQVRSSKRLDFQLALIGDEKQRLRIETWGNELVLVAGDSFMPLRALPEDARELALRVGWNRKTGNCSVFTPEGEKLAEWQAPEDAEVKKNKKEEQGLFLHNKGRDLTLETMKVRAWDGAPPAKIDPAQPRLELLDGRVLAGSIGRSVDGAILLKGEGEGAEQGFPIAEVSEIIFSSDRPEAGKPGTTLSYADGTLLHGRIASIKEGTAAVEVSFVEAPLNSHMDALRQLSLEPVDPAAVAGEPPLEQQDKLVANDTTLHGKLSGGGENAPRWLPIGGLHPAKLAGTVRTEIHRAIPADAEVSNAPALFYLRHGDVLPGTLRALDAKGVELESPITTVRRLSAEDLDAIYFDATVRKSIKGFKDAEWHVIKGNEKTVIRAENSVGLELETAIGHPMAMQSSEIKFQFETNQGRGYGGVRLRLFCAGTDPAKSTNLVIMQMGNQLMCGIEDGDGQIEEQRQIRGTVGEKVMVRLSVSDKALTLHLNEQEVFSHSFPMRQRAGYGLILEPASMWGNPVQPITLSDFSSIVEPGGAWVPDVNPESRLQALTVPRFRKETPPRHILIAANGDLLRGEIEAMTSTHVGFRSGLETLRIPRDRMKAAVWLKKPAEGEEEKPVDAVQPKWLDQVLQDRTHFGGTTASNLLNYLQNQVPELKFRLPKQQDTQRHPMEFGRQTVGEALDRIASLFGMHYTIDETGTVVFESGTSLLPTMAERVYWLKSAVFPGEASPQEMLTAKGVPFPKEASAQWQSARRYLMVINTPENLAKVDEILKAEVGENSFVSPSHWFQLTNGARLGLKVDRFEQDFVEGEHPLYGRCRFPISEVYTVRTFTPASTPAMRALAGWRLTFAPEPVLPESGGESSPALGKEAKPIKLPLLAGGDFELSKAQGKVVVLDFWATWCGPCIKSLPGLIAAMEEFSPEQVQFIGVNQGEPAGTVKRFLETRDWKLTVALDSNQSVGRAYGVEGIPHTVVIGRDGKVAWVKTGYTPTADKEVAEAVKRLLAPAQADASASGQ